MFRNLGPYQSVQNFCYGQVFHDLPVHAPVAAVPGSQVSLLHQYLQDTGTSVAWLMPWAPFFGLA